MNTISVNQQNTEQQDPARLHIAIQKSGRLAEDSIGLLKQCGVKLVKSKDQLFCKSSNFPIDVFFVRDDDIPAFVDGNVCQVGMVGENVLIEKQQAAMLEGAEGMFQNIEKLMDLGFGKCRLSLAVPQSADYGGPKTLAGKTIATSYPGILSRYLKSQNIQAKLVKMEGAVEIAPRTKLADAICDLVSTGSTLALNGLIEKDIVLESQAVLIKNPNLSEEQKVILDRLMMRLNGVRRAQSSKYIMLHAPVSALEDLQKALPGSESPTIVPLEGREDLVAIHAVCDEGVFWDTMEDLKARGATSILVLPIEKMLD